MTRGPIGNVNAEQFRRSDVLGGLVRPNPRIPARRVNWTDESSAPTGLDGEADRRRRGHHGAGGRSRGTGRAGDGVVNPGHGHFAGPPEPGEVSAISQLTDNRRRLTDYRRRRTGT